MFSDKKNINILTSLLVSHGIRRVVVCPGSRNAPIIHNLNACQEISCYPVTDERSAGFYALGMALADSNPVAVCVTSGTALLNVAPAVPEASYQNRGVIVISADRPGAWIGQLDGQTLPQQGTFGCFVSKSVTLPEPHNEEEYWHCNRLVNEALSAVCLHGHKSVHINVPISEPLFNFNTDSLPAERYIKVLPAKMDTETFAAEVAEKLLSSDKPMIVVGQMNRHDDAFERALDRISAYAVVIREPLSSGNASPFDFSLLNIKEDEDFIPDFVLYAGGTLVSKRFKFFLRKASKAEFWAISEDREVHDTFTHLSGVIEGDPYTGIIEISKLIDNNLNNSGKTFVSSEKTRRFIDKWNRETEYIKDKAELFEPQYSQMAAVKEFESCLCNVSYKFHTHYANSTSVRLAGIYSRHFVWCNRGVNGIEGSLSTAAGFSVATDDVIFCIIGDLSFFYDQNALWNTNLRGNFRILLLNNGCGGIFYNLKGLDNSEACDKYVAASHHTNAEGICSQNRVSYRSAHNMEEMLTGLSVLTAEKSDRPIVLEVFTNAAEDQNVMKEFIKIIHKQ